MATPCNKYGASKDGKNMRSTSKANPYGNKLQGDIGEQIAAHVLVNKLGLTGEFFDQPDKGIDSVYRDREGKLVVIESKMTEGDRLRLKGTKFGQQLSPSWLDRKAELMQTSPGMYSPDNARIGNEIDINGAENVRTLAVHTNPDTFVTKVYEKFGERWQVIHTENP